MNRETLDWGFREFVKFMFRPKGFEGRAITASALVLATVLGGNLLAKIRIGKDFQLEASSTNVIPEWVQWSIVVIFIAVILFCVWVGWRRFSRENELRNRKKVVVLEGRGLRDDDGAPLVAAVPDDIVGLRIPIGLDLRQRKDGVIVEPQELLPEVDAARRSVQQHIKQNDRQDVTLVYGGLTSVPMTFLTGVMFDDEGSIVVMDWDRTREKWRLLDGLDDGQRFNVDGLDGVGGAEEIVLAVSVSFGVRAENIATTFTHPVVHLSMPDINSSHWSSLKQSELAETFYQTAKRLEGMGVKVIHLLLAAQNSLVFNLGRRYDKRNVPDIVVYQYEAKAEKTYPWGVRMPVAGTSHPSIVRT